MTRSDYLDALRNALSDLPPDVAERVIADCNRRFDEALAAGSSEAAAVQQLGTPEQVAAGARAAAGAPASGLHHAAKAARVAITALGLFVFNAFMAIPAMIYASLLMALYAVALACYVGGIGLTAATLADVHEFRFDGPPHQVVVTSKIVSSDSDGRNGSVVINGDGITVEDGDEHIRIGGLPYAVQSVTTGDREELRRLKAYRGAGIIIGGILLILLAAAITRFTWLALKHYILLNVSLLRNA